MIRLRGLGTPLFESAFVTVGLKYGSGKRRTRATLRFSRRARCPHRAVLGRPGVPPLRRESKPDSASGTGDREGRPYGFMRVYLKPWRAGLRPAPTADTEAVLSFRRGRTLAGPREGHTPGWLLSAFGRFTFSPSPTVLKKSSGIGWGRSKGLPPIHLGRAARCAAPTKDSASGTGDRKGRPYGFMRVYLNPWRAGLGPAPTADIEAVPSFRRGRTLAGPQMYAARPGGRALQTENPPLRAAPCGRPYGD